VWKNGLYLAKVLKKKVSRETWNNLYPVGFRQSQDVWVSVQAHVTIVYDMNPQTKHAFHNYRIRLLSRPLEKESITIISSSSSSSSGSSRKKNHQSKPLFSLALWTLEEAGEMASVAGSW